MSDPHVFPEPPSPRYVVMFSEAFSLQAAVDTMVSSIGTKSAGGIAVASSQESGDIASLDPGSGAGVALSFTSDDEEGGPTAVVTELDPDQLQSVRQMARAAARGAVSIEREQRFTTVEQAVLADASAVPGLDGTTQSSRLPVRPDLYPLGPGGGLVYGVPVPREYVDVVRELRERLAASSTTAAATGMVSTAAYPETTYTWGLQATGADTSPFTGEGIKVAVLDTGLNFQHPDFQGGVAPTDFASFISGETAADAHGHGTHTAGTAAGPRTRAGGPGYGIAHKAQLYVGKVLGDSGTGSTAQILEGMRWAMQNGCAVVNMSLARRVGLTETTHSDAYESVAQHALAQGTLIVAAAGNFSSRPALTWPVCEPANCPSIMAVGAVDEFDRTASFSCGGNAASPAAARVDIAGPGVRVFSSYRHPELYWTENGTSMAAPHVAGIAALHAQVSSNFRGVALWNQLVRTARRLPLPAEDVGFGLVQAP